MRRFIYKILSKIWPYFYRMFTTNGQGNILSSWECELRLRTIWPKVKVSSPDRSLIVLPLAEMEKDIRKFPYWMYKWIAELFDCDDYALCLHAHMRVQRLKKYISGGVASGQVFPSAFGQAWGAKMMGVESPHAINVMICIEGIFVIEPQSGNIMKADPERDKAWEIRF